MLSVREKGKVPHAHLPSTHGLLHQGVGAAVPHWNAHRCRSGKPRGTQKNTQLTCLPGGALAVALDLWVDPIEGTTGVGPGSACLDLKPPNTRVSGDTHTHTPTAAETCSVRHQLCCTANVQVNLTLKHGATAHFELSE